jgi:hypothetical protein
VQLTIARRYCGPPESGNGGWVSGSLAEHVPTDAERPAVTVRLASPPPLEQPLDVVGTADAGGEAVEVRLLHRDHLVATGTPAPAPTGPVVVPATLEEARAAELRYEGLTEHPFPTCFSCGTAREPGDALCLQPGPLDDGSGRYATSWRVPADGIGIPLVWAALDCPGGWAAGVAGRPMVLGTMTAVVHALPDAGSACVVTAWQTAAEGRRHWSASMLHSPDGDLLARAAAVWVAVDPASVRPQERP